MQQTAPPPSLPGGCATPTLEVSTEGRLSSSAHTGAQTRGTRGGPRGHTGHVYKGASSKLGVTGALPPPPPPRVWHRGGGESLAEAPHEPTGPTITSWTSSAFSRATSWFSLPSARLFSANTTYRNQRVTDHSQAHHGAQGRAAPPRVPCGARLSQAWAVVPPERPLNGPGS